MELNIDCIIGIDPGASGGIAIWRPNQRLEVKKMPKDVIELSELFKYYLEVCDNPIVFIEKVQLRPDDMHGGKGFRIQEMLNNYQRLKDTMEFSKMPFIHVHPISWQSYLNLRRKGEDRKDRKNRYKDYAQELYPEIRATLWNADACLMVQFGRKKMAYDPYWIVENLPSKVRELFGTK